MRNTTPRVNMNGSGFKSLMNDNLEIWRALDGVLDLMCQARPHGRDWQTESDPKYYQLARSEWETHITNLRAIHDDLAKHIAEISEQDPALR